VKLVAVTACPTGIAHTEMAAHALLRVAELRGQALRLEARSASGTRTPLTADEIAGADAVVLAADIAVDEARFAGKPIVRVSTARAIRETEAVLDAAVAAAGPATATDTVRATVTATATDTVTATVTATVTETATETATATAAATARPLLVAVTACPTGIAHTFMAAEALKKAAASAGYDIRVETQGSVGAKNTLDPADIARAHAVIIGADTHVAVDRFAGKRLLRKPVGEALKKADQVVAEAIALPAPAPGLAQQVADAKAQRSASAAGPYKHLLTGVSFMLPLVVAGGLVIALSFVFGIEAFKVAGSPAASLMTIGQAAFGLMVPVLAGYIAFSIADRPGLAPGLVGGALAAQLGAGFLGGIAAGFLAGYLARAIRDHVPMPASLEGLKPVLIIPLLATLATGLLFLYVVAAPVKAIMDGLTGFLTGLTGANALLLGALLGGMMAVDMGGPVNKAAYAFSVGLLTAETFTPMAATMAAGMTPPLGLALATALLPGRFTVDERAAGKVAAVLGLAFITEGAIPFAARDPLRVIPACIAGSAVTGAISMAAGCALRAPHGGAFVMLIPNAVAPLGLYVVAIAAGTAVTALALALLKRPLAA
jgi:PTS system fructose-specific IIC component